MKDVKERFAKGEQVGIEECKEETVTLVGLIWEWMDLMVENKPIGDKNEEAFTATGNRYTWTQTV